MLIEKNMYDICLREKVNGRVPEEIEFLHAEVPEVLSEALEQAKKIAADEVSPSRRL